jgi:hypothetical protein
MKIGAMYSHLNGHEWLLVHRKALWKEIIASIEKINANSYRTKISKEKTMHGKKLFAPKELNKRFKYEFERLGWEDRKTSYWVTDDYDLIRKTMYSSAGDQKKMIEAVGKVPIYSYNQSDFFKDRVVIEVQLGKYSFIAYDLFVKHLAFYVGNTIDVGIEILPMKVMQAEMSSGPGYYEGALYDLARQVRGVPAVPLVLIGVEP